MTGTVEVMDRIVDTLAPDPCVAPPLTPARIARIHQRVRACLTVSWHDCAALLAELDRASNEVAELAARVAVLEAELAPWRAIQDLRDAQLARSEMTR